MTGMKLRLHLGLLRHLCRKALPLPAWGAEHGARGEGIDGCCTDGGQGAG